MMITDMARTQHYHSINPNPPAMSIQMQTVTKSKQIQKGSRQTKAGESWTGSTQEQRQDTEKPVYIHTEFDEGQVRLDVRRRGKCAGGCGDQVSGNGGKDWVYLESRRMQSSIEIVLHWAFSIALISHSQTVDGLFKKKGWKSIQDNQRCLFLFHTHIKSWFSWTCLSNPSSETLRWTNLHW